jgi:TRAP-type uncharacterized transport system substrate-binding protein
VSETTPVAGRTPVSRGTATPGGGFPVYGEAVAATINEVDATLDVRPRNTKGSTENVPLLEAGALDLALVQGEVAHEALAGIGRAPADLRVTAAMYSTPGMFVVPADSYPGQTADLISVGSWSFIMARPSPPDEVAHRLARALHRGEAALGARRAPGAAAPRRATLPRRGQPWGQPWGQVLKYDISAARRTGGGRKNVVFQDLTPI